MGEVIELVNERQKLFEEYRDKLEVAPQFNRKLVSFQANKDEPFYRWFKYKEGFSSTLVKYLLTEFSENRGRVLDPFAGVGTTLFAAQELEWEATGIELLPVGAFAIEAREASRNLNVDAFSDVVRTIWSDLDNIEKVEIYINHISITKDAFPQETEDMLNRYLTFCSTVTDKNIQTVLRFAAFTTLEQISYTRKDGQYLRWDHRSARNLSGKSFDKGKIFPFKELVQNKLKQILTDIGDTSTEYNLFPEVARPNFHPINTIIGSCLEKLTTLDDDYFDFTITSPPYCNRYDYTRTYALELVFLGCNNDRVRSLRQEMLSCTVENKEKIDSLRSFYLSIGREVDFERIISVYQNCPAMVEVNSVLDELNIADKLNNPNISRMVKNYFFELCFVIFELSRVTRTGGKCVMVNDNVRYGGEEIPVDLILSEFANQFGFNVNKIFVLPRGKGNSSQQMGSYGRTEVRKCIYLWEKR